MTPLRLFRATLLFVPGCIGAPADGRPLLLLELLLAFIDATPEGNLHAPK